MSIGEAKLKFGDRFGSANMNERFCLYATTKDFKEDNFEFCCWNTDQWYAYAKENGCTSMQELFRKVSDTEKNYTNWLWRKLEGPPAVQS
jgi:hypothetical protein